MGIPQLEFIKREVCTLAKLAEERDLERDQFQKLIDPNRMEQMSLTQLKDSLEKCRSQNFNITGGEIETIFKLMTKSHRSEGLTMSVTRLVDKVYNAVDALLIERVKEGILRSMKPLGELFAKFDGNKDGYIEYRELEDFLLEIKVTLQSNFIKRLI